MPKLTLAQKLEKAAQRKARAEQAAARIKLIQSKQHTRALISLGGLVDRAGLAHLPEPAIYACLLRIAEEARDPDRAARWELEGRAHFQKRQTDHTVAVARFAEKLGPDPSAALRELGFRRNRLLEQWEGRVPYSEAASLVASLGGEIMKIAADAP